MEQDATQRISKGALSFFSGTFISRISGLGRDIAMAVCFGSHPAIAAFMVAYRFSNLLRRMLGEGTLSSGFIPYFECLRKESPGEGARFFRDVFFSMMVFLAALVLFISFGLGMWLKFVPMSQDAGEILSLTFLMIPGLLFICLYAVSSALLQCERKFFLPGVAPVLFNLTWIGAVLLLRDSIPESAVIALSGAVVFGFFLQWALLVPSMTTYLRRFLSWKEISSFQFFPKEVKALLTPFFLGLIGVSATQVNSFLDALFARYASLEGPAYLWYSIRIQQLPLALFGIALSAALLPPLSRAVSKEKWEEFAELLRYSLTKSFHFIFPCTIALFVLAACGVNLLYGRGDFDCESTRQTIFCLWGYGVGLLPYVFVLLLAPAFYAQKNFRTPMRAAVLSMLLNVAFNALFIFGFHMGTMSIALATSLSAWFNFLYLSKSLPSQKMFETGIYKGALAALIAGGVTFLLGHYLVEDKTYELLSGSSPIEFARHFKEQALSFFVLSGVFCLTFVSYAWLLDVKEVLTMLRIPRRQKSLSS